MEAINRLGRCFLFLVNYARMKPDVALKALPVLKLVSPAVGFHVYML